MNKESKLNLNAGDYAISHCDSNKTYNGLEVHKMLCDAYIAGNNDTLEDDDERIKNSLINLIKMSSEVGGLALHKWEADEMLAWLEKQGQVKESTISQHEIETCKENDDSLTSEYEKIRKWIIDDIRFNMNNEPLYNPEYRKKAGKAIAWLERQGEQKPLGYVHRIDEDGYYTKEAILEPNPYTGTGFDYNGHHWGMCARDGGVEILMDGNITSRVFPDKNNIIEQKPTDSYCHENCKGFQETGKCFADGECKAKRKADSTNEVEPKFKVGDKIYLKPEYRMPDDDTPIANTVKEIRRIDDKHYRFDGSYIFIEDQDKYELVEQKPEENKGNIGGISSNWSEEDEAVLDALIRRLKGEDIHVSPHLAVECLKSLKDRVQHQPKYNFGDTELTQEELCEGLIRGMVDEHNRVTKEVLRNEYEKGRADVLAKIDAIDVDEMVYESGATSRVTQYWYAHGVNDVIKKLKEE